MGNKDLLPDIINDFSKCINFPLEAIKDIILCEKVELYLLDTLTSAEKLNQWFPGEFIRAGVRGRYWRGQIADIYVERQYYGRRFIDMDADIQKSHATENHPLISLYCMVNYDKYNLDYNDILQGAKQLSHEYGINIDDYFLPISYQRNSIKDSLLKNSNNSRRFSRRYTNNTKEYGFVDFYRTDGSIKITLVNVEFTDKKFTAWLPISHWTRDGVLTPELFLFMPNTNDKTLPLMYLPEIDKNNHATIVLSEHIDMTVRLMRSGEEYKNHIFTTWFGGKDSVEYVDWSPLRGRCVVYIIFEYIDDDNKDNLISSIKTALALYKRFSRDSNMHFYVFKKNINASCVKLNADQLIELAEENGISIAGFIEKYDFVYSDNHLPGSGNEICRSDAEQESIIPISKLSSHQFLIAPFMRTGTLTILYAPAGLGKSWLAMSMGLAVANGADVFDGWQVKQPQKVYFLAGEMNNEELKERIVRLNEIYQPNGKRCNNRFALERVNMNLATEEGQKQVECRIQRLRDVSGEKVSFLILDNLSTLVVGGEYPSTWNRLFSWLDKLKHEGMTILLVHHANRAGTYLGSVSIANKADFVINAQPYDNISEMIRKEASKYNDDDYYFRILAFANEIKQKIPANQSKLKMYISQIKLRSVGADTFSNIEISLDVDSSNKWELKDINYEEIFYREFGMPIKLYNDLNKKNKQDIIDVSATTIDDELKPRPIEKPFKDYNDEEKKNILKDYLGKENNKTKICKVLKISRPTLYKYLKEFGLR